MVVKPIYQKRREYRQRLIAQLHLFGCSWNIAIRFPGQGLISDRVLAHPEYGEFWFAEAKFTRVKVHRVDPLLQEVSFASEPTVALKKILVFVQQLEAEHVD